jgi:hypothetical protein
MRQPAKFCGTISRFNTHHIYTYTWQCCPLPAIFATSIWFDAPASIFTHFPFFTPLSCSYCAWPGQAVAYKIGQIAILDMKKKAREKLGADFDVKAFHRLGVCCFCCRTLIFCQKACASELFANAFEVQPGAGRRSAAVACSWTKSGRVGQGCCCCCCCCCWRQQRVR